MKKYSKNIASNGLWFSSKDRQGIFLGIHNGKFGHVKDFGILQSALVLNKHRKMLIYF